MTFTDILDQYRVPYLTEGHHHCRPGWVQIDCPFCGKGSDKYHMGYNLDRGFVACWRCRGHPLVSTLVAITGEDRDRIKNLLKGLDVAPLSERKNVRGTLVLPKPLEPLSKAHLRYLEARGISAERAAKYRLQGLGAFARVKTPADKKINLAWRIFIPYLSGGEIVSWTTRTISDKVDQRYIAAPADCEAEDHKEMLFGADFAQHAVCAVEGEFDTINCGPGFVGVGGTAFKRAQVLKLAQYSVRGVWFDKEPDAQRRARELVDMLSVFPGKTYNIDGDSEDPGSASRREINEVKEALGL